MDKTTAIALGIGVVAAFLAAGLWLYLAGQRNRTRAIASQSWPTARGTILQSMLTNRSVRDENTKQSTTYYTPVVRYTYEIGGVAHEADTIRFGSLEDNDAARAQGYCDRYPTGAEVDVRYDPANPKIATLETISEAGTQIWLGLGLIAGGVLTGVVWAYAVLFR